jgi:imidazolonepropionase-like amidohydrolase
MQFQSSSAFRPCCACGAVASLILLALVLTWAAPASAQMTGGILIENAHVLVGDGSELDGASILIRGDRIAQVGTKVRAFMPSSKIDAAGKFITPGLIDVWSTLGLTDGATESKAAGLAADNFDPYAKETIEAAHRQGVTLVYVPARATAGVAGFGAVVRLIPGGSRDEIVVDDRAGLCASLGGAAPGTVIGRVRTAEQMRVALRDALDYREALEFYEEDLKDYLEALKKQSEKSEGKDQTTKQGDKQDRKPRDQQNEDEKDGKPDGKEKQQKKGPKKPEKPARDLNKEALLEALEGRVRWRVEAYAPADILNALDVAREFDLALVLEGAAGAHDVAGQIAARNVPVVLDARSAPLAYIGGVDAQRSPDAVQRLLEAGVDVYFGSGPHDGRTTATPHIALRAAQAVAAGMSADEALQKITYEAARLLGVDDKFGRLKGGNLADLVIWSDHPFAPGAHVERVFVNGREVYKAEPQQQENEQ